MENLEFFRSLGLTEYESKTISSLLRLESASPKQISESSKVPQNKLYQIIKNFISLGMLSELPNKKYKLINFKTFVDEKISKKENQLKQLKQTSRKINQAQKEDPSFQLIHGQIPTMNKIAELNEETKKEILGIQRNWKIWGKGLRVMQDSINRGVKIKTIGVINDETKKRAREWRKCGCNIKKYNKMFGDFPLRFTIFDNKIARVTIGKPEIQEPKNYITFIITSKPFIAILKKQFIDMWEKCEKF